MKERGRTPQFTAPPPPSTPQSSGTNSSSAWVGRKGSGTPAPMTSSLYDNQGLGLGDAAGLQDSLTSASASSGTTKTASTVRTVNWKPSAGPAFPQRPQDDLFRSTLADSHNLDLDHHMSESVQVRKVLDWEVEELLTDEVMLVHPRSLLILASVEAVVGTQVLVLGMIASFYEGSPWGTALWVPVLCVAAALTAILFLKLHPRRWLLYVCALASLLCLALSALLFGRTAALLAEEDKLLRRRGWNFLQEHIFQLNRIVENTKIAMYSLHLILAPILGICFASSLVLFCLNIREAAEGKVRRGYYVSSSQFGHQTVLVPVKVKGVAEMPSGNPNRSVAIQTSAHLLLDRI